MIQHSSRHQINSGFTLIELLVTITILVLSLGMAIAGYLRFEKVQRVQQTARDVQQLFTETRKKSQIRDQTGCEPTSGASKFGAVTDYKIKILSGSPMMTVRQETDCTSASVTDPFKDYDISSSVSVLPDDLVVTYSPLTATAVISSTSCTSSPCEVTFSDGSIQYKFDISAGGQIGSVQKL